MAEATLQFVPAPPIQGADPGQENGNLALFIGGFPFKIVSITRSGAPGAETWVIQFPDPNPPAATTAAQPAPAAAQPAAAGAQPPAGAAQPATGAAPPKQKP